MSMTDIATAVKNTAIDTAKEAAIPLRRNFVPLLFPILVPAGIAIVGAVAAYKVIGPKASAVASIFSAPVVIGAGAGYAIGAATKADDRTRVAYAVVGLGAGWILQQYIIGPAEVKAEADAATAAHDAAYRWYNPLTW